MGLISVCFGVPSSAIHPLAPVLREKPENAKQFKSFDAFFEYCAQTGSIPARVGPGPVDSPRLAALLAAGAVPDFEGPLPDHVLPHYPRSGNTSREEWRDFVTEHLLCGKTVTPITDIFEKVVGTSKTSRVLFADPTLSSKTDLSASLLLGLLERGVDVDVSEEPERLYADAAHKDRRNIYERTLSREERTPRSAEEIQKALEEKVYDCIVVGGFPHSEASVLVINRLLALGYEAGKIALVLPSEETVSRLMLSHPQVAKILDAFVVLSSNIDPVWKLTQQFVLAGAEQEDVALLSKRLSGNASVAMWGDVGRPHALAALMAVDSGGAAFPLEAELCQLAQNRKLTHEPVPRPDVVVLSPEDKCEGGALLLLNAHGSTARRFVVVLGTKTFGKHGERYHEDGVDDQAVLNGLDSGIDKWLIENPCYYKFEKCDAGHGFTVLARLPDAPPRSDRPGAHFADLVSGLNPEGLNVVVLSQKAGDAVGWREFDPNANVILLGEWDAMAFRAVQDDLRNLVHDSHLSVVNGTSLVEKLTRVQGTISVLDLRDVTTRTALFSVLLLAERCTIERVVLGHDQAKLVQDVFQVSKRQSDARDGSAVLDFPLPPTTQG